MLFKGLTTHVVGFGVTPTMVVHPADGGVEVTVYPVIAEPPVSAGAIHASVARPLPGVPWILVGAPGTPAGVTLSEAVDAADVPKKFVALTVNVYGVPLVRPSTVHVVAEVETHVPPTGFDVTV